MASRAIAMPEIFCLDQNPEETLACLSLIRAKVLTRAMEMVERKISGSSAPPPPLEYFDFATMRYISPTTALIIAAIYDRVKAITGSKLFTVDERRWNPGVKATLQSLGFHEFLDMQRPRGRADQRSETIVQKFTTGTQADGTPVGKLQEALANLLPADFAEKLFDAEPYAGMFEAILNSHSWAYPVGHVWDFQVRPNWWLTGTVNKARGRVTVVVFDQGVSIPVALPRWKHFGRFEAVAKRFLARLQITAGIDDPANDGLAIRLAMTISKSQTNLPQHGKGLHTMIEVAQRARNGRLRIISRNGEYVWETGRKPKVNSYGTSIGGTLVEWSLDL